MKTCRRCKLSLPFEAFSPDSRSRDGRTTQCRSCRASQMRRVYQEGPQSGFLPLSCLTCTGCGIEMSTDFFYPNNRSRTGFQTRCKVCHTQGLTASYRKHPEKYLLRAAKKRAQEKGVPFALTLGDIQVPKVCPVLGLPLEPIRSGIHQRAGSPSIDEIIPGGGYVPGNVAIISWRANSLKRDGRLEEFRQIVRWLGDVCDGAACEIDFSKPRGVTN